MNLIWNAKNIKNWTLVGNYDKIKEKPEFKIIIHLWQYMLIQ